MPEIVYPECSWCHETCDVPENTRKCDKAECYHDDFEVVYCSRSCLVAAHG